MTHIFLFGGAAKLLNNPSGRETILLYPSSLFGSKKNNNKR